MEKRKILDDITERLNQSVWKEYVRGIIPRDVQIETDNFLVFLELQDFYVSITKKQGTGRLYLNVETYIEKALRQDETYREIYDNIMLALK